VERDQAAPEEYYILLLLLLQTGMLGVFVSRSISFFFMFLGSDARADVFPDRGVGQRPTPFYAAIKFFLYTLAGSVVMLLPIAGALFLWRRWRRMERGTFDVPHSAGCRADIF